MQNTRALVPGQPGRATNLTGLPRALRSNQRLTAELQAQNILLDGVERKEERGAATSPHPGWGGVREDS